MLAKETYRVNCPKNIVFGNRRCPEEQSGEQLQKLGAEIAVPENYAARVVLEEMEIKGNPHDRFRVMNIVLAREQTIESFMEERRFFHMSQKTKVIGTDSPEYFLRVDGREMTFDAEEDRYQGAYVKYCWDTAEGESDDAVVVTLIMPGHTGMDEMREAVNGLFDGMRKVKNVERYIVQRETEETPESEQEQTLAPDGQDAMTMN